MARAKVIRCLCCAAVALATAAPTVVRADLSLSRLGDSFSVENWQQRFEVEYGTVFENVAPAIPSTDEPAALASHAWHSAFELGRINSETFVQTFSVSSSLSPATRGGASLPELRTDPLADGADHGLTLSQSDVEDALVTIRGNQATRAGTTGSASGSPLPVQDAYPDPAAIGVAPVPSALLLGAMGLGLVCWLRSRAA